MTRFGRVALPATVLVPVALIMGTAAAAFAFLLATLAANTVEGIALNKALGVPLIAPVVALLVVPEPYQFLAGAVSTYWPLKAVASAVGTAGSTASPWPFLLVGAAANAALAVALVRAFARRADRDA